MLRVAILDHHPVVRQGLEAGIGEQGGLSVVGTAADRDDLWPLLMGSYAEVLVLGQPARDHATELCRLVRMRCPGCRVVLYATRAVAVAVRLAGAHALVERTADVAVLREAIWTVVNGGRLLPPLTPAMTREAAKRLPQEDQAILAMLLAGTAVRDAAAVAGLSARELEGRRAAILAVLGGRRVALDPDAAIAA